MEMLLGAIESVLVHDDLVSGTSCVTVTMQSIELMKSATVAWHAQSHRLCLLQASAEDGP